MKKQSAACRPPSDLTKLRRGFVGGALFVTLACFGVACGGGGHTDTSTGGSGGASGGKGGSGGASGGQGGSGGATGGQSGSSGAGGSGANKDAAATGGSGGAGGSEDDGSAGSGGATGGSGGAGNASGGTGGSASSIDAGAEMVDIHDVPATAPRRAGYAVLHSTNVSMWEFQDPTVYTKYKANFDEVIGILEHGYFAIQARLGTGLPIPFHVIIEKGDCCGGFAGGGDVGYSDGDFMDDGGMNWIRGVVLGEVSNNVTGTVTSDWPRDWWADSVWYFPGFVAVDVMKEVAPAHATMWETNEKYPTYPVYVLYKALLGEKGWGLYQKLFASIKTDQMDWSMVGENPSALKTNYVVAYVSLAAGANLADRFTAAKVDGVDATVVGAIMDAHDKLVKAGAKAGGWGKFRTGDYQGAVAGL